MTKGFALWRRLLRFCLFSLIALVTLVALGLSWISFQGRRDWAMTKADLLARGEKLSFVELAPPAIPDDQNFYGDPMWKELLNTVDTTGEFELPSDKPRVPLPKHLVDAIAPPLSPALVGRSKIVFDDGRSFYTTRYSSQSAARESISKLNRSTDPALRRALAQFALDALASGLPARQHVEALLGRPGASFNRGNSKAEPDSVPILNRVLRVAQIFDTSARAHLELDDAPAAAQETLTALRLAETLQGEPELICRLVRVSILSIATSTINRGIATHQWSDANLTAFEKKLAPISLPREVAYSLRASRGASNQYTLPLLRSASSGKPLLRHFFDSAEPANPSWKFSGLEKAVSIALYRFSLETDQASLNRLFQQYIDKFDQSGRIDPKELPGLKDKGLFFRLTHVLTIAANQWVPTRLTIYRQDDLLLTRIACALERYRLRHSTYPDSLEATVPDFLPAIPDDIIAGQNFHYRRESPDKFRLWSAGWNQIDEGGTSGIKSGHYEDADWVWNSPPGSKLQTIR